MNSIKYAYRPIKSKIGKDEAATYLRNLIDLTDKTVYTSLVSLNGHSHAYGYIALFMVLDGKIINISYPAALVSGLKIKETGTPTPFVRVPKGMDMGKSAVQKLQHALYEGMILKERLRQEWV